ncbi:MAG: hypothetical protein Q8O55_01570 [Dehalococcoidales bacterium]|nr:hypothetical protein [Dehalococcoidales bacterium]
MEKIDRKDMTTIWVEKSLAKKLRQLGTMDDTYSTVIRRLMNGSKPDEKEALGEHGQDVIGRSHH